MSSKGNFGGHSMSVVRLTPPQPGQWQQKPKRTAAPSTAQVAHLEALLPSIDIAACRMNYGQAEKLIAISLKYLHQKGTRNKIKLVTMLAALQDTTKPRETA